MASGIISGFGTRIPTVPGPQTTHGRSSQRRADYMAAAEDAGRGRALPPRTMGLMFPPGKGSVNEVE
ncbi:hypothetical protein CVCC1112_1041 [Paenarthrobacter nicotinovorans]|nr:hypothetical protein CVCC1112_1041 [Paenarthrobacter nicotinovorans]